MVFPTKIPIKIESVGAPSFGIYIAKSLLSMAIPTQIKIPGKVLIKSLTVKEVFLLIFTHPNIK